MSGGHQGGCFKVASRHHWAVPMICLGLFFMVLAVYARTIHFGFIDFDDNDFVTSNAHVLKGLSLENVRWAMIAGTGGETQDTDYWRPVSILSQMADVQFFGLRAGYHHAVNVLLHALNSLLLFLMLRSLTGALWRSAFVAALFALHPLHVESVAWISERKDLLSALFFLLTLVAYTRYARKPFDWIGYLLVVLWSALARGSKPRAVTIPCVLILFDYWPLRRLGKVSWPLLLMEKAPLFAMSFFVAVITVHAPGGANEGIMDRLPWPWRLGNAAVAYATYLREMVWPVGLTAFYPHPGRNLPLWNIGISASLLLLISALVVQQRMRRYLSVGWLWYLGMLFPVIGIIQSGEQSHADRYTYLPLIGIFIMLVWSAGEWAGNNTLRKRLLVLLGALWLSALILITRAETEYWSTSKSLWSHALACNEANAYAHYNLGTALDLGGKPDEALPHYERALDLLPKLAQARNNIANILLKRGEPGPAIPHLEAALKFRKEFPEARYNLGCCLALEGRIPEAVEQLSMAVSEKPGYAEAHEMLGNLLLGSGYAKEAIPHFRKALEINPNNAATRSNLGTALSQDGDEDGALTEFQRAVTISPENIVFKNNLAWVLATSPRLSLRNGSRAVVLAEWVVSQNGDNAQALCTLAAAYAESNRFLEALKTATVAKKIAEAQGNDNLARILGQEIELYQQGKAIGK